MLQLVASFGVLIVLTCAWGVADFQGFVRLIERFAESGAGYAFAIIIRVILGGVAILAAPDSLHPLLLYIIGVIALVAAVTLLAMGRTRFERMVRWVTSWNPNHIRLGLFAGMVFGVALVWVADVI